MSEKLFNENKFRSLAKKAVVEYWNSNKTLIKKFGEIGTNKVFVVWRVEIMQNAKAMLGVSVEGNDLQFEFAYNCEEKIGYLDVYALRKHVEIEY